MRITGGTWRGRTLTGPGKLKGVRPTADRVREALFSILTSQGWEPEGSIVLDLFAGTGALGLEALSRGAAQATFVEKSAQTRALLTQNIAQFTDAQTKIISQDATRLGPNPGPPATLIFADPPYAKGLAERALAAALKSNWIASGALIVVEESEPLTWPEGFTPTDTRRYGDTQLHLGTLP